MQTYSYGHDFGNAETCGVMYYKGQRLSRSIPSATAQGRLSELQGLGINLGKTDYVFKDVDGTGGEMYIGDLALTQSNLSFTGRGDINRYWSSKSRYLLLTVAASLIDDAEFALNIVTGLPVQTYIGDPESRQQVKRALEGKHTFALNGRVRCIHVTVERVIMEGAGALIVYGAKERGVQGVIDIGGRTTDLFAANMQTPVRQLCSGKPLGVEMAADLLSAHFQALYGRTLKADEKRDILYAHVSGGTRLYPTLYADGQPVYNLKALVQDAIQSVGSEVASFVSTVWNDSETGKVASSFAQVLIVGGGAYYFQEHIQRVIPNAKSISHPQEANALGYAALAERQLQQRLNIHIA